MDIGERGERQLALQVTAQNELSGLQQGFDFESLAAMRAGGFSFEAHALLLRHPHTSVIPCHDTGPTILVERILGVPTFVGMTVLRVVLNLPNSVIPAKAGIPLITNSEDCG